MKGQTGATAFLRATSQMNRLLGSAPVTAAVISLNLLMSGCAIYRDPIWQPLYPGASTVKNCRSGGQTSIDIQLTNSAVLTVRPAYIDRHDGLSLGLLVASGTTLRLVSDKARIETSHELVLVPLQYQGSVGEIAPADRQDGYDLKGRPQYYLFHVPEGDVKGDHFALILPIILDPERNLDMVRVQFDRRTAYCVVGMQ